MANAARKLNEESQVPQLKVHENPLPQGLIEIKAMFKDDKHSPAYVYTKVLTDKERQALTFIAKFPRTEIGKPWRAMTVSQKQDIRQALMFLNNIVLPFIEANAMEPHKFIQSNCH